LTSANYITGKVAAILTKFSVVINKGYNDGVVLDDTFYIFTEIGPFYDPDTNEDLGTTKKIWGKVRVTTLEKRFCIAETDYTINPNIDLMRAFGGTRVQLPVDEREFARDVSKVTIGTSVILGVNPKKIDANEQAALPDNAGSIDQQENDEENAQE